MDEVERRLEVDVEHSVPLLLGHAEHESVLGDTGIVDEHIDRTEVLLYLNNKKNSIKKVDSISGISLTLNSNGLNLLATSFQSGSPVVV